MSIQITSDSWGVDSRDWLLARKGFDTCRSETADLSLFTTGLGFSNPIPSGTVLGKVTATGLIGPYNPDGADGRQTAVGHLFNPLRLQDAEGNAFTRAPCTVLWEGIVRRDNLPTFSGDEGELDAAAEVDLKFIRYER